MSDRGSAALVRYVGARLAQPVQPAIETAARDIADRLGGIAVLFYGSVLRTHDPDGIADFYVLTPASRPRGMPGVWRLLWPDVSYHEVAISGQTIRAKVATMPIDTFARAAGGATFDTTIWARFVQRSALIWSADDAIATQVVDAVAGAAITAARFAAMLGPRRGTAADLWKSLFRATYQTELRFEKRGREDQILGFDAEHYDRLLPLAWAADGIAFQLSANGDLTPDLGAGQGAELFKAWRACALAAKPLNVARLIKAAFTFDGAARYALWKIGRHTGVHLPVTPFRERHPILAAPAVLLRVWMASGTR